MAPRIHWRFATQSGRRIRQSLGDDDDRLVVVRPFRGRREHVVLVVNDEGDGVARGVRDDRLHVTVELLWIAVVVHLPARIVTQPVVDGFCPGDESPPYG